MRQQMHAHQQLQLVIPYVCQGFQQRHYAPTRLVVSSNITALQLHQGQRPSRLFVVDTTHSKKKRSYWLLLLVLFARYCCIKDYFPCYFMSINAMLCASENDKQQRLEAKRKRCLNNKTFTWPFVSIIFLCCFHRGNNHFPKT